MLHAGASLDVRLAALCIGPLPAEKRKDIGNDFVTAGAVSEINSKLNGPTLVEGRSDLCRSYT